MLLTTPSPQSDRAVILDVLRGIAVFGILLNNIYAFSGYGMITDQMREEQFTTYKADMLLNLLQILFIEGKFYTLFSLLFGIGFSIFLLRGEAKGINAQKAFFRRLIILAIIGFLHLRFIWMGDILFLYALLGFLLPLFTKAGNRALLIWGGILILSPIIIDIIKTYFHWSPFGLVIPTALAMDTANGITEENWRTYLFNDYAGFAEWKNFQATGYLYRYGDLLDSNRFFKVFGIFLLGFYVGRNKIYTNLEEHQLLLKKVRKWGFIIGIPFSIAMALLEGDDYHVPMHWMGLADTFSYAFGVVPLSLAYTATICLWWMKSKDRNPLNRFAAAGRMALTNYVMQSIIGILLFYSLGLGLGQEFGLVYVFLIAVGIYLLQVLYSGIWLRYFQYGPLEWIWRMLTYGKWLRLSRSNGTGNPRS